MACLIADYTYTSQLPLMLTKITSRPTSYTGPSHAKDNSGMTTMQVKLWDLVWHMKEKVNADPEYCTAHAAIRQFTLERWVWRTYWPENQFPGDYPARVDPLVVQRDSNGQVKLPTGIHSLANPSATHQDPTAGFKSAFIGNSAMGPPQARTSAASSIKIETKPSPFPQPSYSGHINIACSLLTPSEYKYAHLNPQFRNQAQIKIPGGGQETISKPNRSDAYGTPELYASMVPRPDSIRDLNHIRPPTTTSIHNPVLSPALHPLELCLSPGQIQQILNNIMRYKHTNYVPTHGWDPQTGLPRYAVLNLAPNAHIQFFGGKGGDGRFERVRGEFSLFRIMFQRLDHGAVIVWIEAKTKEMSVGMARGEGEIWGSFGRLWAFLRTWAEYGNTYGKSENVVDHLVNCKSAWENFDISGLTPPSAPNQQHQYQDNAPTWNENLAGPGVGGPDFRQQSLALEPRVIAHGNLGHRNGYGNEGGNGNEVAQFWGAGFGSRAMQIGGFRGEDMGCRNENYEDRDQPAEEMKESYLQY